MIRFVTLGTNDLKKSSDFYDEILKILPNEFPAIA